MNAKPWYQSATIYALMVSITAQILHMLGLGDDIARETSVKFVEGALPLIGIFADAIAAWGRARANGPVSLSMGGAAAKSKQGGFASVWMLASIAAAVIFVVTLSGCVSKPVQPEARLAIETSVRIAVRHAVADSPRATEKAANIREIVGKLKDGVSQIQSVTAEDLEAKVRFELDQLEKSGRITRIDRADADDLLGLLSVSLESLLAANSAYAAQTVPVQKFLDMVLAAIPAGI